MSKTKLNFSLKMKQLNIIILLLITPLLLSAQADSSNVKKFTLEEVIKLAKNQSPKALVAKHSFRANYWKWRSHKADFLPSLNLNGTLPNYNRSITREFDSELGKDRFYHKNILNTDASLSIDQNIGFTGGKISLVSKLERIDYLDEEKNTFLSKPLIVRYDQPITGYNKLRWSKRIEPKRYEAAKRKYVVDMEEVSQSAVNKFFSLALAQQNLKISKMNYSNADTLYKISKGRYNIGTIAENELLQMELSLLNADVKLNDAIVDFEENKIKLRSFLGFNESINIELIISDEIPEFEVDYKKALSQALENSPKVTNLDIQLLEAEERIANERSQRGLSANLFAEVGLTKSSDNFSNVYVNPENQQNIRVGISLPILDWGKGRGRVKMAKSNLEMVKTEVEQSRVDFRQNILLDVMRFNLLDDQIRISSKADVIARNRYNVTKQRFLIGKINVLDLNISQKEKDEANTSYINMLKQYWSEYFKLRMTTLYDFEKDMPIEYDLEKLID